MNLFPLTRRTTAVRPPHVRRALVGLVSAGLLAGTALLAPVAATGAPPNPEVSAQISVPARYRHTAKISRTEMTSVKIVRTVANHVKKGKALDYRYARSKFGSHTTWRRKFAAGWQVGGGRITHISATEQRKVNTYKRLTKRSVLANGPVSARGTNCTGDTTYFSFGPGADNYYFFDSCVTNKLTLYGDSCVITTAAIAAIARHAGVSVTGALIVASCGLSKSWIGTAQKNSKKNAIILVVRNFYVLKDNTYRTPVVVAPQ